MPATSVRVRLDTAEETQELGVRVGRLLRAGDLVVLTGGLGAGKTTLTQGIGEGLGVRGPVTSPTFVIARIHPSLVGGPPLVHVDAYRLGGVVELDDLDLDADVSRSVTVVEWGHGVAERLAESYLEVTLGVVGDVGGEADGVGASAEVDADLGPEVRVAEVAGHGSRWVGGLQSLSDGHGTAG